MKREIIVTSDGSKTIHIPEWNEQYHSKHGAVQEAQHVFITHGLRACSKNPIYLLEIGFGTGLNCFITLLEAKTPVVYTGIEAYPVGTAEIAQLNYPKMLGAGDKKAIFDKIHSASWEEAHTISPNFVLTKQQKLFSEINDSDLYDLIYFDAFGARVQPELWTETIFDKMYRALKNDGILVTYSAKGSVRRAMQAVGFLVERLPGPPGKREMLRAIKK